MKLTRAVTSHPTHGAGGPAPKPRQTEINGRVLDESLYGELAQRSKADGKVFSMHGLVVAAIPFSGNERVLPRQALEKAYATIAPSRLPPQTGEATSDAVSRALRRAWSTFKPTLGAQTETKAGVPLGFSRVIVQREGQIGSENEVVVSAYLDPKVNGSGLRRLGKETHVFFERLQFGEPRQLHGPFAIDADGIPTADVAPTLNDDGVSEAGLLAKLPSQVELSKAHQKGELLSLETFAWSATDTKDLDTYLEISARQRSRLSSAQYQELQGLAAYRSFGPQTPAVNDWLRAGARGKNLSVKLLDQAFERAVSLPPGLLMFRGLGADAMVGKNDKRLVDPAYLSVSLDPDIARMFADNAGKDGLQKTLLVIEAGEGSKALATGNKGEVELLLPRSQPLRIVKQRREKGYLLLHARME